MSLIPWHEWLPQFIVTDCPDAQVFDAFTFYHEISNRNMSLSLL